MTGRAGGLIPLASIERQVHMFDGVTYRVVVTWLRRGFAFEYHSPRLSRDIRRQRGQERARLAAKGAP